MAEREQFIGKRGKSRVLDNHKVGDNITVSASVIEDITPLAFSILVHHGGDICEKSMISNIMWSVALESNIQELLFASQWELKRALPWLFMSEKDKLP